MSGHRSFRPTWMTNNVHTFPYRSHDAFSVRDLRKSGGVRNQKLFKSWTGGTSHAGKIFRHALHFFGSTCIVSRFGERFRAGQYSLVSFLFSPIRYPRAQPFVKAGACPLCPVVPAPLRQPHSWGKRRHKSSWYIATAAVARGRTENIDTRIRGLLNFYLQFF